MLHIKNTQHFFRGGYAQMRGINTISVLVILLLCTANAHSIETTEDMDDILAFETAAESPTLNSGNVNLQTATPILSIEESYDFRDYPMPPCASGAPLCGTIGHMAPTQLFIALPTPTTIVSSYIQTWQGGYWSVSLHKEFTLLNVGVDW